MSKTFVATSEIVIEANPERIWDVITDPVATKEFMFGADLVTDWTVGGPIHWRGTWEGKDYEDKGEVLKFEAGRRLVTTHFSPLTGEDDVPENYHTLTWSLAPADGGTRLTLTQDNNDTPEAAEHSQGMWDSAMASIKEIAERT